MSHRYFLRLGAVHLPYSRRFIIVTAALAGVMVLVTGAALCLGTTDTPLLAILRWLLSPVTRSDAETDALMQLRAPRVIVALLGGAMVAASGYLLQVVSGNGLADPGLIGISPGVSVSILIGSMLFGIPAEWLAATGLIGGLMTGALVLTLAFHLRAANGLILIGLAVSVTLGAVIEIVMVSGGITQFSRYITWSHGSLTAVSFADAGRLAQWAAALGALLVAAPRLMAPLMLGAEQASAIGAAPRWSRPLLVLLATALVAPVVSLTGPIAFVGLIAAHTARRLVADRPGEVLPVAMLIGALLLLLADIAGRTLFLPVIVPAGLIVSIVGVIGFLAFAKATAKQT